MATPGRPESPRLTVDGIVPLDGGVVLVRRGRPPFAGRYALPGGFVDVGETTEAAVVREVLEETGLATRVSRLAGVYSDPSRDPRGHTVSVAYELSRLGGTLAAGDDGAEVGIFPLGRLPDLAFDHAKILSEWMRSLPGKPI
ncbi:MAG TPA: NUDIX hydrolase [Candidatus Thermoplasmatota archaeon]|nr:NUDIX hydrolase [Candidatus Thermoplasmatota archaeon]